MEHFYQFGIEFRQTKVKCNLEKFQLAHDFYIFGGTDVDTGGGGKFNRIKLEAVKYV